MQVVEAFMTLNSNLYAMEKY